MELQPSLVGAHPQSWGRYVWVPNRWSRRGGLNMRNWRFVLMGERSTKKHEFLEACWYYWRWHFSGDDFGDHYIFWGGRYFLNLLYTVWGDLFFGLGFLGSFFSPITWIYPPTHPVGFLSVWLFEAFLFEVFLKIYADVSQESRRTFHLYICKANSPAPQGKWLTCWVFLWG